MSFDRQYLLDQFPAYDYHNGNNQHLCDYRVKNNRQYVTMQIQCFPYYWAIKQCADSGEIGLSLGTPNLPYCLTVLPEKDKGGHVFHQPTSVHLVFEPESFPLLICSAALPALPCTGIRGTCVGSELTSTIRRWLTLLKPGGILAAILLDERYAKEAGGSLLEISSFRHTWSAQRFLRYVLEPLGAESNLEEYDTLKNNFAFDVVLRKTVSLG